MLPACGGVSFSAFFGDFDAEFVPIEFQTIAGTGNSAIDQPRFVVVRDIVAWDALWREHTANLSIPPPLPGVNFARDMAIGVFLGSRPNACYSVAIQNVTRLRDPDRLEVVFREFAPPPGALCATVITNPAALAVTPFFTLPVQFIRIS